MTSFGTAILVGCGFIVLGVLFLFALAAWEVIRVLRGRSPE